MEKNTGGGLYFSKFLSISFILFIFVCVWRIFLLWVNVSVINTLFSVNNPLNAYEFILDVYEIEKRKLN